MNCSQCKGYSLEPIELEPGLVAASCHKCEGVLLPLLNYQFWSSAQVKELPTELDLDHIEDNKHAVICPKCARFMLKYRIDIDQANRLDVCANCGEIWLDKGEWELFNLKQDPAELNDLSKQHPDKLKELIALWGQYKIDNKVLDISLDLSELN